MTESEWKSKTVLVVDDSQDMRRQVSEVYRSIGLNVIAEAENGIEAISIIQEKNPDIVSLDIIMPEMDGVECYSFIKANSPKTQCLFVSILSNDVRVLDAYQEHIDLKRFLPKPLDAEKLKSTIVELFGIQAPEQAVSESVEDFSDLTGEEVISAAE